MSTTSNGRGRHVLFALPQLARLPYHVSTIGALAELGAQVTVVVCRGRKERGEAQDTGDGFLEWVDSIPARYANVTIYEERGRTRIRSRKRPRDGIRHGARTLRSYSAYLRRLGDGNPYTERWRGYLTPRLQALTRPWLARRLLGTRAAFRALTAVERRLSPDPSICSWLEAHAVDVVVASPTTQRNSAEVEFVKAATARGIPTAVPVLSWDNLSTKGLVPCPPTALLAWNTAHKSDATAIHGLEPASVLITGSPFFDKWFRPEEATPRQTFLEQLGLAPDARYVLYLGSSTNIALNESWLVKAVRSALDERGALADIELVVRPHPANRRLVADVTAMPHVTVLESVLPFSDELQRRLYDVTYHADAFIGVNTSAMLDAIVVGKPGFSILDDTYRETHAEAPHFRHMRDADVLYLSEDAERFATSLERVLAGDDPKAANRSRFVTEFVRPRGIDVPAGRRQAQAILGLAEGASPTELDAVLGPHGLG